MNKVLRDRINAAQSQLADLKRPKMGKSFFDLTKIKELEDKLKSLKMKIISIEKVGQALFIKLDNGETAGFHQFGGVIYSSISEGLNKSNFKEFKKDIEKFKWNEGILREIWIEK